MKTTPVSHRNKIKSLFTKEKSSSLVEESSQGGSDYAVNFPQSNVLYSHTAVLKTWVVSSPMVDLSVGTDSN